MSESVKSVMAGMGPTLAMAGTKFDATAVSSGTSKEKVCQEFESFMLYSMLKYMEKTAQMSKKGYEEETYMAMVYQKVADFLAERGVGIKEMLMKYADKESVKVIPKSGDNSGKR